MPKDKEKRARKKADRQHNKHARKTEGSRLRMKLFGNKSKTTDNPKGKLRKPKKKK
jgi:hypothetical protein